MFTFFLLTFLNFSQLLLPSRNFGPDCYLFSPLWELFATRSDVSRELRNQLGDWAQFALTGMTLVGLLKQILQLQKQISESPKQPSCREGPKREGGGGVGSFLSTTFLQTYITHLCQNGLSYLQ